MGKPVFLIVSQKFSNLFNSYTQVYNKENNRKGSLFVNRYKRILISDKKYLLKLIHYIHYNPVWLICVINLMNGNIPLIRQL